MMWLLMWSIFLPIPAFYCGFQSEVLWQPVYLCLIFMVMWIDGFIPVSWPQIPARWMCNGFRDDEELRS